MPGGYGYNRNIKKVQRLRRHITMQIIDAIGQSLLTAAGMAWQVLWSLVLGFTISGMIQAYVSRARMSEALGRAGFKEIALATAFGAASSSCSYAAVAAAKSMFKRGAIPVNASGHAGLYSSVARLR